MVDLMRHSALDGVADFKQRSAVLIAEKPPLQRWSLRIDASDIVKAEAAFGCALPLEACHAHEAGDKAALWLGPDEWLLLAPVGTVISEIAAPHSLVDISHRQMALDVSGGRVEDLLNSGVLLDLRRSAFPVGMCVRTLLGKIEIVLWRRGAQTFHVEFWRSFASYGHEFLKQASAGL